jgi:hypothetical protein
MGSPLSNWGLFIVKQMQKLYNKKPFIDNGSKLSLRKEGCMGYGRKSTAGKMLRRKGQAKKKSKIREAIAQGKLNRKK